MNRPRQNRNRTNPYLRRGEGRSRSGTAATAEISPRRLTMVLALQDKNAEIAEKVDLAYDYVELSDCKKMDSTEQCLQVLNTSRTIVFLNNWVQSVLIASEKKTRFEEYKPECGDAYGSLLDIKCWKILQFCLKESENGNLRLTFSKDFLRVVNCIVMDASSCIKSISLGAENAFPTRRMELYGVVLDCISSILSSHGGVSNANLDLWILLMNGVLGNVIEVIMGKVDEIKLVNFVMQLLCYFLEEFAKFLWLHPTRKSGFHDFIDKLLEPMLQLLHLLNSNSHGHSAELKANLIKLIGEVLGQGLFHPTHIDGFLSIEGTSRYKNYSDVIVKEEKSVNRSYHRHFFDVVEKIVAKKNGRALVGLGELLHLFVICAMKHKEASSSAGGSDSHANDSSLRRKIVSEIDAGFHYVDAELRKSIFDFFVQIMECLLIDVNKYLINGEVVSVLSNVPITLRSINSLLATYVRDKLYLRTEDASEGACRNFLQIVYGVFTSLSQKISHQHISYSVSDEESLRENFVSVRLEIIAGVHHLLDIEYEVFGSDLESIWDILLSSMACFYGSVDVVGQHSLFSQIIRLGCRMIDLYSELRQVKSSIFALCRAVRHSMSYLLDSEACNPSDCSSYLNSLSTLICSSDFRSSLSNAAMAIPEGQVAECIRQLNSDVIESLEWIKIGLQLTDLEKSSKSNPQILDSPRFNLQVELLGRVLSEVYTVLLKSTNVSCGNSYLVGVALKSLLDTLQPIVSNLVSPHQPDKNISVVVGGRVLSRSTGCGDLPMGWILVFSFQLLCYCRFFVRSAICLMPPETSVKMSNVLGDSFTAFSGNELLEMAESADKGNIPWISPPTETLNVLHSICDLCIHDSVVTFAPLVYISNVMAMQRLNDLNRSIKSLQFHQDLLRVKLDDDADSLVYHRKRISRLRKEASGLTKYITVCLSTIAKKFVSAASDDGMMDDDLIIQHLQNSDGIDVYVGPMDDKLLPSALWLMVWRNTDIWFPHASKKDLNRFVKLLIQAFCISLADQDWHFRSQSIEEVHCRKELARRFLNNMELYDQQFLVRHMAPRICRILQKSVTSLFPDVGVDLSETPDWVEVISALKNLSDVEIGSGSAMLTKSSDERKANAKINSCEHLLSFIMGLPKEFLAVRAKSLSINYILNLERVLLGSLLGWYGTSGSDCSNFEIFQLFHICRSVLRILFASSYETNANLIKHPPASKHQDFSFLSWLLESVYAFIPLRHTFPGDAIPKVINTVFSMINSTSDIWLTISRYHCERAMSFNLFDGMQNGEREGFDHCSEESEVSELNLQSNSQRDLKTLQSVLVLAETLKVDMQNSVITIQNMFMDSEKEGLHGHQEFNKLSSMVACFHGLLSGLASSLRDGDEISKNLRTSFLSNNPDLVNRINSCIDVFVKFAAFFMNEYFLEDDSTLGSSPCGESSSGTKESMFYTFNDIPNQDQTPSTGNLSPSEMKGDHKKFIGKRKCHSAISELESSLNDLQHKKRRKKALLLQVIKGENAEAAFFLHHLFMAFSVVLRMAPHIPFSTTLRSLYPDLVDISRFLLLEFSRSATPPQSGYFWLNGVVKFLEELGRYFPKFDPSASREHYVDLIDLHIRAIGKCILLQGKNARLDSQWTASTMVSANESKSRPHSITSQLIEFQRTLRSSFRTYIMEPSTLQLRSSLQAVERAIVGLHQGLMTSYEIFCGYSNDGGYLSLSVAGAVDCLALILEDVKGHQRLKTIKKNIHSFVASLFNIILHLQGPDIFCINADSANFSIHPDSGPVILMCIEVLTRIYGKASHFNIDESQIAQSLRIPGALFQYFLQLQISEGSIMDESVITPSSISADWKLSVELYNACCCLLCAALKHHKSETSQFMAVLENSVSVLLHRLEIINTNPISRKDDVRNALTCANSLRRVYEELRQQKETFSQYAYQFLSRYIHVYCGFGPARKGIIREIDDALKPGIYALIDICSADELQLLHTMFGEGPCRSTLGALQHDYKVNFQFKGKI